MSRFKKYFPCITTLAVMVIIFLFSSENAEQSSESSTGFIHFIVNIINNLFNTAHDMTITKTIEHFVRKAAHFAIYAALGFNACWMFRNLCSRAKKHTLILYSTIFSFIYACSDEIHQLFSPGRSGSFADVLLDTSGAFIGSLLLVTIVFVYTYSKEKKVLK